MPVKLITVGILVLFSMSFIHAQCTISIHSFYRNYSVNTCNGLTFQSAISAPSVFGMGCNSIISSRLTTGAFSTATYDAGPLSQVAVFPNPIVSTLNISWNKIDINCQVELFNTLGVKLHSFHHYKGEQSSRMDLYDLSPGFYILMLSNQAHQYQYSTKLLKL